MARKKQKSEVYKKSLFSTSTSSKNTDETENYADADAFYYDSADERHFFCDIVCTKSFLIIFNFLYIISGILLILFGLWTMNNKQEFIGLSTSVLYQASTYLLIFAGGLVIVTGILGITSAWIESKKLIVCFLVLLCIVFAGELASSALSFAYRAQLGERLRNDFSLFIFNEYAEANFEAKTRLFDDMQIHLKCCGASNFLDWRNSKYVKAQNISASAEVAVVRGGSSSSSRYFNLVAESCCKTPSYLCGKRIHPSNINYDVRKYFTLI